MTGMRSGKRRLVKRGLNHGLEAAGKLLGRRNRGTLLALSAAVVGVASLFQADKTQAATLTWDNGSADGKWSTSANWNPDDADVAGDTLIFNNTGAVSGTAVTSIVDVSKSIGGLTIQPTSATSNQNIQISSGITLTVSGVLLVGTSTPNVGITNSFTGDGAFVVNNTAGSLTISNASTSATSGTGRTSVLDMTNLGSFTASVSDFYVGAMTLGGSRCGSGDLTLAKTNTITVTELHVGDSSDAGGSNVDSASFLRLSKNGSGGAVNNTIQATTISVGKMKSSGSMLYDTAAGTGNTLITGKTGGTTRVTTFSVGDRGYSTGNTGTVDFSNGNVTAYIETLNVGVQTATNGSSVVTTTGNFTMGTDASSVVDVNTINAAKVLAGAITASTFKANFNIGGGTFKFKTFNVGADATTTETVAFNLKGGTLSSNSGTAASMSPDTFGIGTGSAGSNVGFGLTSNGTGALTITSAFTLNDNTTATVNVPTNLSGAFASSTKTLAKQGAGTLTLSGTTANLNTGLVTVTAGELDLNKTAGVNAIGGSLTVNGGTVKLVAANQLADSATVTVSSGSFNTNNLSETVGDFNMSGGSIDGTTGVLTAGTYDLTGGTVNAKLGAGTITVGTGTVTLGSAGRLTGTPTLNVGSGQLTLGGNETVGAYTHTGGTLGGSGKTLTASSYALKGGTIAANLGTGTATISVGMTSLSGSVGAATVNIHGGTLALSGSGSFASNATIAVGDAGSSGAVLDLSGKSGGLTIGSGQTLKGIGAIQGGAVTVNSGGHLAPGNSPGALVINNTLTLNSGSVSDFEIASTSSYDQVTGLTGLTYGGTLNVMGTIASAAHTYTLFSLSSGTPSGDFSSVNLAAAPTGYRWHDFDAGAGVDYFNNASGTIQLELANGAAVKLGLVANALSGSLRSDTTDENDENGMNAVGSIHVTGSNGRFVSEIDGLTNEAGVHDFADGYVQVDNDLSPAPTLVMLWLKDNDGVGTGIEKSDVINYLTANAGGAYTVLTSSDEQWQKLAGAYSGFDTIIDFGSVMGTGDAFSWKFEGDYAAITVDKVAVVPEPGSLGLLGMGAMALMGSRRRKVRKSRSDTVLGRFYARRKI